MPFSVQMQTAKIIATSVLHLYNSANLLQTKNNAIVAMTLNRFSGMCRNISIAKIASEDAGK